MLKINLISEQLKLRKSKTHLHFYDNLSKGHMKVPGPCRRLFTTARVYLHFYSFMYRQNKPFPLCGFLFRKEDRAGPVAALLAGGKHAHGNRTMTLGKTDKKKKKTTTIHR